MCVTIVTICNETIHNFVISKSSIMKKVFLYFLLLSATNIWSQNLIDTGTLIQGGVDDGSNLVEAYINPLNKAIVFGLSDVTYTKIKKKQKRRLLLSVKLAYIGIPKEDWTYDVTSIGLKHFEPKDYDQKIAQTIFGDSLKTITLVSKEKDVLGRPLIEFDTPAGSQKSGMPLPYVGATYRLKYTNLSFNLIPYITIPDSDFKVGMIGIGVQQDFALFIKSLQDKAYGLSVQASGNYLYGRSDLDIRPGKIYTPVGISGNLNGPYDNQEIKIAYTSFNIAAYIDYNLTDHFSAYAGAGINTGSAHIMLKGTYPVYAADPTGTGAVVADDIYDPLDIYNTFSRSKLELGLRGDWDRFYAQIGYNAATYGGLSVNLGYKML